MEAQPNRARFGVNGTCSVSKRDSDVGIPIGSRFGQADVNAYIELEVWRNEPLERRI